MTWRAAAALSKDKSHLQDTHLQNTATQSLGDHFQSIKTSQSCHVQSKPVQWIKAPYKKRRVTSLHASHTRFSLSTGIYHPSTLACATSLGVAFVLFHWLSGLARPTCLGAGVRTGGDVLISSTREAQFDDDVVSAWFDSKVYLLFYTIFHTLSQYLSMLTYSREYHNEPQYHLTSHMPHPSTCTVAPS